MGMTIYLNDDLDARLRQLVSDHDIDRVIGEAVAEKVVALEEEQRARERRERIEREMEEGYLAAATEHDASRAWEAADVEGQPGEGRIEDTQSRRPRPRSLGIGASGYADTARRTGVERASPQPWR